MDGKFQEPTREVVGRLGKFLIAALQAHEDAVAFLQPVNTDEVADYADIIKANISPPPPSTLVATYFLHL